MLGKVTIEFQIGLNETKKLAFEQMCLDAPESIIHNLEYELMELNERENQILAEYEEEGTSCMFELLELTEDSK